MLLSFVVYPIYILFVAFASSNSEGSEQVSKSWMTESEDGILPGVNPLNVNGDIISAGSSTVYPLSEAMAERFKDEGYKFNITK